MPTTFEDVGSVRLSDAPALERDHGSRIWQCGRLVVDRDPTVADVNSLRPIRLLVIASADVANIEARGLLHQLCRDRILIVQDDGGSCLCVVDGTPIYWSSAAITAAETPPASVFANLLMLTHSAASALEGFLGRSPCAQPAVSAPSPAFGNFLPTTAAGPLRAVEATGVFVIREGRLLVGHKHRSSALGRAMWYLPGGKRTCGETSAECAVRELYEETALRSSCPQPIGRMSFVDARRGQLYEFSQFVVRDAEGDVDSRDDLASCTWQDLDFVNREEHFPLTWAQLQLSAMTGAIPEAHRLLRSWEPEA